MPRGRDAVAGADGMTLAVCPNCGHFPQLELSERFAQDLTELLLDPDRPGVRLHSAAVVAGAPDPAPAPAQAPPPSGASRSSRTSG